MTLTQKFVKECFEIKNGDLYWKERPDDHFKSKSTKLCWENRFLNKMVGAKGNSHGYLTVHLNGRNHLLHRVVYLFCFGEMPAQIDHIDGNRKNNKPDNLRKTTSGQNARNSKRHKDNTSGYKGVSICSATGRFMAKICKDYKQIYIGRFDSAKDAAKAYNEYAIKYHGEFAKLNEV